MKKNLLNDRKRIKIDKGNPTDGKLIFLAKEVNKKVLISVYFSFFN